MRSLEQRIAARAGRSHAVLAGTGTAALVAALSALGVGPGDEVVVPTIVCPSVPWAVRLAGALPAFCDTGGGRYNMTARSVARAVNSRTRAVIAVHLFGSSCDIAAIAQLARTGGVALIEDFAQALGGEAENAPLGSFGEVAVTSFGRDKILDVGGGGAIVASSLDMARRCASAVEKLSSGGVLSAALASSAYRLISGTAKLLDGDSLRCQGGVARQSWRLTAMLLHPPTGTMRARIEEGLERLDEVRQARRERAGFVREALAGARLGHPEDSGGALTMYTVTLRQPVAHRLIEVRRPGQLRNLYPPAHQLFGVAAELPEARALRGRMVNIPLAPEIGWDELRTMCARLKAAA